MLRFRRVGWPREVAAAVEAASRAAGAGKDSVLAAVQLSSGEWVAGTRAAVYLPAESALGDGGPGQGEPGTGDGGYRRVGWERIERAGWDAEASVLQIYETADYGTPMRVTDLTIEDAGRFGQLLRERIDASILVQRHIPLRGKKGIRVVGRRNPADRDAPVSWNFVLDKGLEPTQPGLLDEAEAALTSVRDEFGI